MSFMIGWSDFLRFGFENCPNRDTNAFCLRSVLILLKSYHSCSSLLLFYLLGVNLA